MRLVLTGGGTGGHVYPALAVLQAVRANASTSSGLEVLYVGAQGSIEERLALRNAIPFEGLRVGGLRGQSAATQAQNALLLARAFLQMRQVFGRFHPQVIFATGGYASAAAVLAGALARIPILIYLPDLEPGVAIQRLSPIATKIAVSFPEVVRYFDPRKTVVTGYPVRPGFFGMDKQAARAHFQLVSQSPAVTFFGGSRGASSINRAIQSNLGILLTETQVIHITGTGEYETVRAGREALSNEMRARYFLAPYLDDDMPLALGAANLVVARAGAATLGEFPAVGVPSLLIPYPYAGQHQDKNAEFLVQHGAAAKLEDERLAADLGNTILGLLHDPVRLQEMSEKARGLSQPDAAARIAQLLDSLAQ